MKAHVLDAIHGHVPRTEGEKYDEFSVGVMLKEILKHPRYLDTAGPRQDGRSRLGRRRTDAAASP